MFDAGLKDANFFNSKFSKTKPNQNFRYTSRYIETFGKDVSRSFLILSLFFTLAGILLPDSNKQRR